MESDRDRGVTTVWLSVIGPSHAHATLRAMTPESITALFVNRGQLAYEGEGVTQLLHGWQSARLARQAGAAPALQLAAWLHDLGHLMTGLEGSPTVRGIDDAHEVVGARALALAFGPAVSEPVALHVQAKRCLTGLRAEYRDSLSPDSIRSLALQGGPMTDGEIAEFMQSPHAQDALRLRTWDDQAKRPDLRPQTDGQAMEELQNLMRQVRMPTPDPRS
jgi:predicted HD phosphohydrolase